jgi:hypothetical protein
MAVGLSVVHSSQQNAHVARDNLKSLGFDPHRRSVHTGHLATYNCRHLARTKWAAQLDDGIGHTLVSTVVAK